MKLHLPKQLFTALLAAITLATPAALTLSSAAWGAEVEINNQQLTWDANTDFTNYAGQQLRITNGTSITMSGGDRNIEWLRVHDLNSSTTETFTLSGGTLNVTYADDGESSSSGGAAVVLGHWSNGTGKMEVTGGTLNVLNGTIRMGWDSSSILNISGSEGATSGGVVNAKGIRFLKSTDASDSDTLTLSSGGRLNVGTLGIANSGAYDTKCAVKLNGGTLGALDAAGWTLRNVDTTIGHITIDTNVWDAATGATATGDAAGSANISLLGALTAQNGSASSITLLGSGSLTINHTWDGTIQLGTESTAKVYLQDINNFDRTFVDATGATASSGFIETLRVSAAGSEFADNKVYIGESSYTVTDGLITDTSNQLGDSTFYVNDAWTFDAAASAGATAFHVASAGTFTCETLPSKQISNNGNVIISAGTNNVNLNSIFNAETGITQTATGTTTISGSGTISMSAALTSSGSLAISGTGSEAKATFNSTAGLGVKTLVLENATATISGGQQALASNITLNSGATLTINSGDLVNYGGTQYTWTVNEGATLNLGTEATAQRQTLARNFRLILAGGVVNGKSDDHGSLDYYNNNSATATDTAGTIQVTKSSVLNAAVRARGGQVIFQIDGADTVLTMGSSDGGSNFAKLTGGGSFVKQGAGSLLYKGDSFDRGLSISGGVFEYYLENNRTHSGSISGSGTFRKSGSGTLTLDSANTSVTTLNVTGGKLVYNSTTDTTHTISGASGTFFEKTGSGSLTANTNNYSGEILVSAGTLKNSAENQTDQKVTVANGATVDLNGKAAYYNLTLQEGATLTNSVTSNSATGTGKKQLHTITLEGDAKVTGSSELGMVGSGHTTSNLHLNGNTLTKEGTNTFHLFNTTVHSAGLIQINGGTVKADGNTSGTLNITKASLAIDGGTFQLGHRSQSIQDLTLTSGSLTIGSGLTLTAQGDIIMSSGTVSGNLCLSGTITLTGDGTNTVNLGSAVLSGTSLRGFTQLESAKPTTSGLQALTYQLWSGTGSVTSTQTSVSVGGVSYAMDAATGTFTTDGTVYYVVEDDTITAGGDSAAEGTASATSFVVDGTLNIAGNASDSLTTVGILTTTTGTGTMVLQTNATLGNGTATQFKGDMQIDSGSKLALGSDAVGDTTSAATVDVSTLRSVKLNGGELYIRGVQATLNEVESVADSTGSQLTVYDMTNAAHAVSIGTLTLNAALQLNAPWKSTINVDNLTGSGALSVNRTYSSGDSGDTTTLNINSLAGFTGSMTVGTSGKATNLSISTGAVESGVSFGGITTTAVNNFEFNVQTNTTVGTLNLNGSTADTISVESGKTLTVSTALSGLSGSLTLGEGAVLNLTGLNVGIANDTAPFVMVNNAARGEGVVKYQGYDLPKNDTGEHKWRVSLRGDSALTLNTDVEVLNGIAFNTYNTTDKHIYSNRNLTVGGELRLESQARLTVSAGSVSAGTIGLGHAAKGNPGHLELTGGSITTGGITKTNSEEAGNTLTMSGGMLEITSASGIASGIQTTITGGTLKASGDASWGITGASIGGAVIETGTGSISLAGGTLTNKLNNTAGNLALSGEFNVVSAGYADKVSTLNATSNGYASTSTVYTLVSDASKLSGADTVTWKMDGAAAAGNDTLNYADGALTHVSEGTEYYVVGSDISYSGIGKNNAKGEALTALVLNGKGVNLDAALGEGVKIKVQKQGESVVAIGSGLTLNSSQVESTATQKLKLHGSGTYTLASGAFSLGNSVVLGAETSGWTGTVKVSNVTYRDLLTELNKLGNASSTVSVSNAVGYFDTTDDDGNAFNTNLYLEEGDAITLTNGNSVSDRYPDRKVLINGDVSGEGNIVVTQSGNGNTTCVFNYEFAGDVSDWTGTLSNKVTKSGFTIGVAFSGTENSAEGNNIIKANVLNEGSGKSHLTFSGSKKHEMKGQVDVNVLNVNMSTDFSNTVQVNDELVVANGQTATITSDSNSITAGNVNISQQNATMSNVTVQGNSIHATSTDDGAKGSISNANVEIAQLQEDASFTIEDMTLTNTTITAATPTTQVNFSNVTVAGATVLRNMQASMTSANVAAGGSDGVKGEFTASTSLLSGITLANTDAVGSTITVDLGDLSCAAPMGPGKYDLSITLSGFTMQDYTQGIVFAADSWLGQLLTAQGATAYVSGAVETPASVSEGGSTGGVSVSYSAATGGNVGTVITITGLNVPEPASATLGLAALMMLCARRRRKA